MKSIALKDIGVIVIAYGIPVFLLYTGLNYIRRRSNQHKPNLQALAKLLGRPNLESISLNPYEQMITSDIVFPNQLDTTFDLIGGLREQKRELWDLVILPMKVPSLLRRKNLLFPKGILLYGAPGTGKTMLAKAIAKETNAVFINVRWSTIMNKWLGESNKLVAAIFSLAEKFAPAIIFIDEIDKFMNEQDSNPTYGLIKSEFLTLWDGLTTNQSNPILIIAATNKPQDIDQAILRRLPRSFEIKLPVLDERREILRIILADEKISSDLSFDELAERTEGYSGSDLKELCRAALIGSVRDAYSSVETENISSHQHLELRPIIMNDFEMAFERVRPTGVSAREYANQPDQHHNLRLSPTQLLQLLSHFLS